MRDKCEEAAKTGELPEDGIQMGSIGSVEVMFYNLNALNILGRGAFTG
jgi:hypothetical protein